MRREFPSERLRDHKSRIKQLLRKSKTPAGREDLTRIAIQSLNKHGILCLSEDPANMLMWSYYAEGHKGIAVRFNMDESHLVSIPEDSIIIEVEYSTDFPDIPYYEISTDEFIDRMFRTKSSEWQHEQEWRLVLSNRTGYLRMPSEMIDGIVLGLRTEPKHEKVIRGWIEERSTATELLRVRHLPDSFKLETVPVT